MLRGEVRSVISGLRQMGTKRKLRGKKREKLAKICSYLQNNGHPENRQQWTAKPTAVRVLKAFSRVTLTIIQDRAGREVGRWLTPLSSMEQEIMQRLGLELSVYAQLEMHHTRE